MTREQERAIKQLKEKFLGFYGYPEMKEFKEERIREFDDGVVYIMLEVGCKNDEHTMASILCRNTLSVMVGKKGGFYTYSDSNSHYKIRYNSTTNVICRAQWKH